MRNTVEAVCNNLIPAELTQKQKAGQYTRSCFNLQPQPDFKPDLSSPSGARTWKTGESF